MVILRGQDFRCPLLWFYCWGFLRRSHNSRWDLTADRLPPQLSDVGIEQKLNQQVPLDLPFRDEEGRTVKLGEFFDTGKPVVLALVYFDCPMMCSQVLNSLATTPAAIEV